MGVENLEFPSPSIAGVRETCITYEVERQAQLEHGFVEVGRYRWPSQTDVELRSKDDSVTFNLALSPRPVDGRIMHLDDSGGARNGGLDRVMLLKPGCAYRVSVPAGRVRALYCEIDRRAFEALCPTALDLSAQDWQSHVRARMPVIELLLNRMYEELREEHFASDLALDAYSRALCVELARCLRPAPEDCGPRKGGLAPWRMRLVRQRVSADAPAPRLPELAALCGLTVRQLSRAFRAETGQALGAFVVEATIERAAGLLTRTDRPIAQIATELGFASPASFTYAFRRATGQLPREVRRRAAA
jgi:AraC family transcriptional regulator